jgi:hypothetical protein
MQGAAGLQSEQSVTRARDLNTWEEEVQGMRKTGANSVLKPGLP